MNWYLVKLIYRIICGEGKHKPQFEEQLRLISACSKEEAVHRAHLMGTKGESVFFNQQQQLVQWQFINVCEIYALESLIDGAELYSRIEETHDEFGYLSFVKARAEHLLDIQMEESIHPVTI
jgi:hypothetical protein